MDAPYTARFLDALRVAEPDDAAPGRNRRTLLSVYDAIIRGDFDALEAYLTEDVELDIRGLGAMDGQWRGRRQVLDAARANFGQLSQQQPEIECIVAEGECIAVLFRESGVYKVDGQGYRFRVVQWFTFADGRIRRMDEVGAAVVA
jgi:ketosteroid isomerase-like protein